MKRNRTAAAIAQHNDNRYEEALRIARFLHTDELIIARIAATAVATFPQEEEKQARRLRYDTSDAARTRSYADPALLLTKLVFQESIHYERRDETSADHFPDPRLLRIRMLKQVIHSALNRNSFYATVAVCRILHEYTAAETIKVYNFLAPQRSYGKDFSHYRRGKAVLMDELAARFGRRLAIEFSPEWGSRFTRDTDPDALVVHEALSFFAPKRDEHVSPDKFEMMSNRDWTGKGGKGSEKWDDELNRMHALIDPACFRDLMKWLKLDAPETRRVLPRLDYSSLASEQPSENGTLAHALPLQNS